MGRKVKEVSLSCSGAPIFIKDLSRETTCNIPVGYNASRNVLKTCRKIRFYQEKQMEKIGEILSDHMV